MNKEYKALDFIVEVVCTESKYQTEVVECIKTIKKSLVYKDNRIKNLQEEMDMLSELMEDSGCKLVQIIEVMKTNDVKPFDYDNTYLTEKIKSILEE